ncbi:hypothetical protein [Streptomyces sp. URMC 129]|uniref:hypothetical protein n=1 Tax=Streptomyces sp. URMC 129 TaxID=3423407 RepID=UPI003F1B0823
MTALTIHLLLCDGAPGGDVCPEEFGGDGDVPSIEALREQAADLGWTAEDGRDWHSTVCRETRPT